MQEEFHNEPSGAGQTQGVVPAAVAISFAEVPHAFFEVVLDIEFVQDSS